MRRGDPERWFEGKNPLNMCVASGFIERDLNKHRMTIERAGEYFRAMMLDVSVFDCVSLAELDEIGLRLPPTDNPTFAEFLDWNADRLQLFDD